MKKIIKISIGVGAPLVAAAIAVPSIIIPWQNKHQARIFDDSIFEKNKGYSAKNKSVDFRTTSVSILDTANDADINLFYTPAVAPFNNLLRLSMLSSKENHFYLIKGSARDTFEDLVNDNKLEDFYNNSRAKSEGKSTVESLNGSVNTTATKALEKINKVIKENSNKRINIWWNDAWIKAGHWKYRVLNLAGYSNVNVQLIEDGAVQYVDVDGVEKRIVNKEWNHEGVDYNNELVSAAMLPGKVRGWYSSDAFLRLNKLPGVAPKTYNKFQYKDLSDGIFNTRDKDGKRLMSHWPEVTGLNWEHEAKIVGDAKKSNGKPSLLLLGSYGVSGEEEYIKSVWERYHDQYNIFYKGHPGHMDHPLFVKNQMIDKHLNSMYQLEPMISSEELTRDHITPNDKGLSISFDKVIGVGWTSAITGTALPNLDVTKDVLEIFYGNKPDGFLNYATNPSQDPLSTNWASSGAWLDKQATI